MFWCLPQVCGRLEVALVSAVFAWLLWDGTELESMNSERTSATNPFMRERTRPGSLFLVMSARSRESLVEWFPGRTCSLFVVVGSLLSFSALLTPLHPAGSSARGKMPVVVAPAFLVRLTSSS